MGPELWHRGRPARSRNTVFERRASHDSEFIGKSDLNLDQKSVLSSSHNNSSSGLYTTGLIPLLSIACGCVENEDDIDLKLKAAALTRSRALAMLGCDQETQENAGQRVSMSVQMASSNICTTMEALRDLSPMLEDPSNVDEEGPHPEDISERNWFFLRNLTTFILQVFAKCKDNVALGISTALLKAWKEDDCALIYGEGRVQDDHTWDIKRLYRSSPRLLDILVDSSMHCRTLSREIGEPAFRGPDNSARLHLLEVCIPSRGPSPVKCFICKKDSSHVTESEEEWT